MKGYEPPPEVGRDATTRESRPVEDPQVELHRRQMALVVRLMVLSLATVIISLVGWFLGGLSVVPLSFGVALVLGLLFTVPWRS